MRGVGVMLLGVLLLALALTPGRAAAQEAAAKLRIGMLPVLNTLPLYIAEAAGYFEEAGVEVEFAPFRSAAKLRSIMRQGELDGFQADLVSALKLRAQGQAVRVARHVGNAGAPFFALVTWPWSGVAAVDGLAGARIAISHDTVIQYAADSMLAFAGISADEVEYVEVADQMTRLLRLAQGGYDAAVLPQPYLKWALDFGSRVLIDDTALAYVPEAISFRAAALEQKGAAVRAFLRAYERAVATLNDMNGDAAAFREFRNQAEIYPNFWPPKELFFHLALSIPTFSTASVPAEADFASVRDWALAVGLLDEALDYASVVDGRFLPAADHQAGDG